VVGDQEWVCPRSGLYTVYAWGPGGKGYFSASNYAGGSGALAIWQRVRLLAGDKLTISIPNRNASSGDTVVTTARKSNPLTAGRGGDATTGSSGGVAGVASGGDININGEAGLIYSSPGANGGGTDGGLGSATQGSPGAPGYDGLRGGDGGLSGYPAGTPGGGGISSSSGDPQQFGGAGLVIICRDK
jgi:hypothetical protein